MCLSYEAVNLREGKIWHEINSSRTEKHVFGIPLSPPLFLIKGEGYIVKIDVSKGNLFILHIFATPGGETLK